MINIEEAIVSGRLLMGLKPKPIHVPLTGHLPQEQVAPPTPLAVSTERKVVGTVGSNSEHDHDATPKSDAMDKVCIYFIQARSKPHYSLNQY